MRAFSFGRTRVRVQSCVRAGGLALLASCWSASAWAELVCRRTLAIVSDAGVDPVTAILEARVTDPVASSAPIHVPGIGEPLLAMLAIGIGLFGCWALRRRTRLAGISGLLAVVMLAGVWAGVDVLSRAAAQADTALLRVLPSSLVFNVQRGDGTTPVAQALTLTNTSNRTVRVSSVSVGVPFSLQSDCSTLSAGASCRALVSYSPAAACDAVPPPELSSVSPAEVAKGAADSNVSVVGAHFQPGAVVKLGELSVSARDITATSLLFTLPSALASVVRTIAVSVTNPDRASSNTLPLSIKAGNVAPVVRITAPTVGRTFPVGSDIPVTVESSDADGTVASVVLRDAATVLANGNPGTWNWAWSGAAAGVHQLVAVAIDDGGIETVSNSVTVTVTESADGPLLTITAPLDKAVLADDMVTLVGTTRLITSINYAGDCRAVEFADGRFAVRDIPLAYGDNQLSVVGTAVDGSKITKSIIVRNDRPRLFVDTPTAGQAIVPPSVLVTGKILAPEGSTVTITRSGWTEVIHAQMAGMRYEAFAPLHSGKTTLTIKLQTPDGRTDTKTIDVTRGGSAARLAITSPSHMDAIESNEIEVTGTYGGPVDSVVVVNGVVATLADGVFRARTQLHAGYNYVIATLTASEGDLLQASVTVIDIHPSAGPIVSPHEGAIVAPGTVLVEGIVYWQIGSVVTINGTPVEFIDRAVVNQELPAGVARLYRSRVRAFMPVAEGPNTLELKVVSPSGASDAVSAHVTAVAGTGLPSVNINSPANGTVVRNSVNVQVTAASPESRITQVELLVGGVVFNRLDVSDVSFSRTFGYSPPAPGAYSLTARAFDQRGRMAVTPPVTIVKPSLPAVAIVEPPAQAHFPFGETIRVKVDAHVDNGTITRVDLLDNNGLLKADIPTPYEFLWTNAGVGPHPLQARATSNAGIVVTSEYRLVTVDSVGNRPPTTSIESPADGASFLETDTVDVRFVAADADGNLSKVELLDGARAMLTTFAVPYTYRWDNPSSGAHILTTRATDSAGAVTISAPVTVNIAAVPNAHPIIALISPIDGEAFANDEPIEIVAEALDPDGTISRVLFFDGRTILADFAGPPYRFAWNGAPTGTHAISALVVDDRFETGGTADITVIVNPVPALTVTSPQDGATVDEDYISVAGTVVAPANSGITVNGEAALFNRSDKFLASNIRLSPGPNTIEVALHTDDGKTVSQTVTVTSRSPSPFILTASPRQGFPGLQSVLAVSQRLDSDATRVDFDLDGNGTIDATRTLVDGGATLNATYNTPGTYVAAVYVRDSDGRTLSELHEMIHVYTPDALDALMRGVWGRMNAALTGGKKDKALLSLDAPARDKYESVFTALLPYMPEIIESYSPLQSITVAPAFGEYAINRTIDGNVQLFLIYLLQDEAGLWKMDSM